MCYNVYLCVNDIFGVLGSAANQWIQMDMLKIGPSHTVSMPQRLVYTKNCQRQPAISFDDGDMHFYLPAAHYK